MALAGPAGPAALRNSMPRDRAVPFLVLVGGVVTAGAVVALGPVARLPVADLPPAFWLMAAIAAAADARPFTPPGRRLTAAVFPSVCLTFAILLGYGLGPAILAQAAAVAVSGYRLRHATWRSVFNLGQYALALAAADAVLRQTGLRPFPTELGALGAAEIGALVLAAAAWFAVKYGTVTLALRLRFGGRARQLFSRSLTADAVGYGALLLLSPFLVAGAAVNAGLVGLVVLPLYAVYRMARLAEDLAELANHDPLTGLGNRPALTAALTEAMAVHSELAAQGHPNHRFALLLLDLDRFKNVNDALGHEVGDRLLAEVGHRIRAAVGPEGVVARLGGDEFAVLAHQVSGTADARARAAEIAEALAEPVTLAGRSTFPGGQTRPSWAAAPLELEVSGSIGIALYPDHGQDVATLLRCAEAAMYDAKGLAAPVAVYSPDSEHHTPQRLALLADLRTALRTPGADGVVMHYQPQIALDTGEVVGVEALLRWRHPTRGTVSPDELIKVAEHTAVMRRLTLRIVDEVVEQVAKWAAAGVHLRASLNVSIRDLHTGEVAERLADQMRRLGVPPRQLQLEITEGALMADPRRVFATIAALDRLGIAISLDDFGTGYSSLQHVRKLPLSEVKVDRSYVRNMVHDRDDAAIVGSIVELAGGLGLRVVAEGVEDEATWQHLAAVGCHVAQGWFCARPMPAHELLTWLDQYRPIPPPGGGRRGA